MNHSVCTVVINYQTSDLLKTAVESFKNFYPNADLLIIDNGSKDNSPQVIKELQNKAGHIKTLFLKSNVFHGPAMHMAIQELNYEFLFFLDSDTETQKGGFLEEMIKIFESSEKIYGVGRLLKINKRGFQSSKGISLPAPAYMMIRKKLYPQFPPFEHHGMPVLKNFIAAQKYGYLVKKFPIENYVEHLWRGTASRFGYGLGVKGKIDFVLNKLGL